MAEIGISMSETLMQWDGTGTADSDAASPAFSVAAVCVIQLSTNNSDFLIHIDGRLLGDFLIGVTNPDHTFLKRVNIFTVSFPGEGSVFQQESEEKQLHPGWKEIFIFLRVDVNLAQILNTWW